MIGRWSDLNDQPEVTQLEAGMDFRLPQYRRAVFQDFYEFHLRHKSHPGGVYYLMPYLAERLGWDAEQRLWYAFINGNTQHPVTSYIIMQRFPEPAAPGLEGWFNSHWAQLRFDDDRKWQKKLFPASVLRYQELLAGRTQAEYFAQVANPPRTGSEEQGEAFRALWGEVKGKFLGFGRLATFSYLEYLRVMGGEFDCDDLFLEDMDGSKSHRNGLAIVLGRDDWDWRVGPAPYEPGDIEWLKHEATVLLHEAQSRAWGREWRHDVSYFTLESTLCCYKSWHRPNRRYPNVYNDMLCLRIRDAQQRWPEEDLSVFWEARRAALPRFLRLEDNPEDVGLKPLKQNFYLEHGIPPLMGREYPCYAGGYGS